MDAPEYFPWVYQQILGGKVVAFASLEELPTEAARDRETCCQLGLKAGLTIGLSVGGGPPVGALSFNMMRSERAWPEAIVSRLQLVAQMFSNALARQWAETALRERESILRLFVRHSPAAIAMLDREMRYLVVSRRWMSDYHLPNRDIHGRSHYEVFPDIPDRWKEIHRRCLAGAVEHCEEDPFPRQDGKIDWVRWEIRPWRRIDDSIGGIIIFSENITDRRQARDDLQRSLAQVRALAGRLQSVREEESKRLAREIHDQLGQALSALRLDFTSLLCEIPEAAQHPANRASSILKLVDETIQMVRRIATELRPGMLDDLGLVATIEWAGEDFQARTGTKCRLDLPREDFAIDSERATAIFRILQETLTNVARHAAASEVVVRLGEENGDLILEVQDNGKGIAEAKLSESGSLGILGMQERALLLGGELNISSAPREGTTVRARIPQTRRP
jgi:PAS domain S-box-containing protein